MGNGFELPQEQFWIRFRLYTMYVLVKDLNKMKIICFSVYPTEICFLCFSSQEKNFSMSKPISGEISIFWKFSWLWFART